jgi:Glycoside hydrolase 123, catalytic domain/Glycoside hydrolase 123 N-terminal domain
MKPQPAQRPGTRGSSVSSRPRGLAKRSAGSKVGRTRVIVLALAVLGNTGAAAGAMKVYTVDDLTRVRPHDSPRAGLAVNLQAARNEWASFQIIVRAEDLPLANVELEASDLRDGHGHLLPRKQLVLYREQYVRVTHPSPKSAEGAGWYPDALVPFINPIDGKPLRGGRFVAAPFTVKPNANQPVWVDLLVPKDTAPGRYAGTVTVMAADQAPIKVPVRLTVWSFTLPDTPSMRSNFGGFGSRIAAAHKVAVGSERFRAIERRYAAALAAHRICPPIPGYLYPRVKADGTVDPASTHAALKEWIENFHVTGFPIRLLGRDPAGKDRARNVTYLRSMYAYLKANGWAKLAYIYVLDEPNDAAAYETVRRRAGLIHEAQPGIKVLCTEQPTPEDPAWGTLVGSVDIWVPLWTLFDGPSAAARLAAGDELWSYTALCQGGRDHDTPYWELDFPLLDYRIPAWINWRFGVTGLLYWTTVYWQKAGDVWTNPATYGEGRYRFNDEGSLFYPGTDAGFDGPVASMRLKEIREGLEDYEYLKLLADRGQRGLADRLARKLASRWTEWDTNPADLYAVRAEMAADLQTRSR